MTRNLIKWWKQQKKYFAASITLIDRKRNSILMAKINKIVTKVYTQFFNEQYSRYLLYSYTFKKNITFKEYKELEKDQKLCKDLEELNKILNKVLVNCLKTPKNSDSGFTLAANSCYHEFKQDKYGTSDEDSLVFCITNEQGRYNVQTGQYMGVLNLSLDNGNTIQLEIQSGFTDTFVKRMLNFCCGVYIDNNTEKGVDTDESIYSLLTQYMFLISLRKVAYKAIPKKYINITERGYNVKGNVDIEAFINHDILEFDRRLTYKYPKQLEVQAIVDVLYTAINCCKLINKAGMLPNMDEFEQHLKELYSGKKPSKSQVRNVTREKCLNNRLYADYRTPLEYAKLLINKNDIQSGKQMSQDGISGLLVDASFIWEMYLYNLMLLHLKNWDISAQTVLSFYSGTFFKKTNRPDYVLTHKETGKVFILDAKFKSMSFIATDVDNKDLQQVQSYSFYYALQYGDKFGGAALLYPTNTVKDEKIINIDNMFGLENIPFQFGVFAMKDIESEETLADNEKIFINQLRVFLGEDDIED